MSIFESETSPNFNLHQTQTQSQTQTQMYLQEGTTQQQQNSILSLTLDEIQTKSGKSFGAMNMDEFLANLWSTTTDENENDNVLARQGSLSLPIPLCKKTVDEVWFEIQNNGGFQENQENQEQHCNNDQDHHQIRRQQTLGEITLEDFLVKAGVVQEPLKTTMAMMSSDFGYEIGLNGENHGGFGENRSVYGENRSVYGENRSVYGENRSVYGENRSVYSVLGESSSGNGRSTGQYLTGLDAYRIKKRIIDGPPEILMERRQRRMIKNRESAARSRARRQAYTVELELELNQLTEENIELKKIVEENEKKRRQEVMNRMRENKTEKKGDKMRRIRRMCSAGW